MVTGIYRCQTPRCPAAGPDRHVEETSPGVTATNLTCHCGKRMTRAGTLSAVVDGEVVAMLEAGEQDTAVVVKPMPVEPSVVADTLP
jgi:hypothetical protein